jgi:hypothetical protein
MPCQCDQPDVDSSWVEEAHAATRAACDLRTTLRRHAPYLLKELTRETKGWIIRHDKEDAERIAEENASGVRERTRLKALDKLTLEERRVLGL